MNSRVHPKYKARYRLTNWKEYERGLVQRGHVTVWITRDAIAAWKPTANGRRGGQLKYSDLAIETALTLRLVFHLPLRQTEGFLNSILTLMNVELDAPDHTTLSRRSQGLAVALRRMATDEPIDLIIDGTGLSIVLGGEWAAAEHRGNGKRGWKKLHLGVGRSGAIVAPLLAGGTAVEAKTGLELVESGEGDITVVVGDADYDSVAVYDAACARGGRVVVPPTRTAVVSRRRPRSGIRDRTIERAEKIGRRRWKKESGYHHQGTVENAFFRYKTILGGRLRARSRNAQMVETLTACNALNRMLDPGRP